MQYSQIVDKNGIVMQGKTGRQGKRDTRYIFILICDYEITIRDISMKSAALERADLIFSDHIHFVALRRTVRSEGRKTSGLS